MTNETLENDLLNESFSKISFFTCRFPEWLYTKPSTMSLLGFVYQNYGFPQHHFKPYPGMVQIKMVQYLKCHLVGGWVVSLVYGYVGRCMGR